MEPVLESGFVGSGESPPEEASGEAVAKGSKEEAVACGMALVAQRTRKGCGRSSERGVTGS